MDLGIGGLHSTLLGALSNSPEAYLGPFPCIKVSNLPFDVSMEDILMLFHGFVVIDVLIRRSHEAFVVFANPMDFQMAMQRYDSTALRNMNRIFFEKLTFSSRDSSDRQTMGGRVIEVTPSQRSEYYSAIAQVSLP